ncbi:NeuB family protein [Chlorobium sp. BLA1]|uniref:N-acetylneuraminate synthase family protein n=1 Tax=Candidatus Chlorobium masyuteum TaxID=2716876 RepID=UPI0014230BC2|nr:N-acetylneuraminate synthase family protein [Candidatus Chlorobium masyuteum]NHQ59253.1 NeuB family protein [Candidatus Chlorobium masyuteum]
MTIEIIAELAQGFEGRSEQARLLMKAAASAGSDAVKYQLVYADELATPDYKYYELFRSLEMADEVWEGLSNYAAELGIQLHVDIFGLRSLELAARIRVAAVKIHGTDIANIALLTAVAKSSVKKIILGAGGAYSSELQQALDILKEKDVIVLLGFQGYPTPNESNQIARVSMLAARFARHSPNVSIGFSDHASPDNPLRYALAATAVGAGAKVIEKHMTLGKVMELEDHESALNPDEFAEFTRTIRDCFEALGREEDIEDFGMAEAEQAYRKMIRRHVVASRDLNQGATIVPADLVLKRTSSEQVVTDLTSVYQKTLNRDICINSPILPADIF